MKPRKSLMSFLFAFLFILSPSPSRAADGWAVIKAGSSYFYLPKDKLAGLQPGGTEALYTEKDQAKKSVATLEKGRRTRKLWVNLNGKKYRVQAVSDVPEPSRQALQESKRPDGISEEIWNVVLNSRTVPPEHREAVARTFQSLSARDPKAFEGLSQAKGQNLDSALAKLVEYLKGEVLEEDEEEAARVLAKALGEEKGSVAQGKTEEPPKPGAKPVLNPDGSVPAELDPINILTRLVAESSDVREHIAKRFFRFLISKSGDQGYLTQEARQNKPDIAVLEKSPSAWIQKAAGKPGSVAILYFVMGEDEGLPAWAAPFPSLKVLSDSQTERARQLDVNMELWTKEEAKARRDNPPVSGQPCYVYKGQYAGREPGTWGLEFFECAATHAERILKDTRVKAEISLSIQRHFQDLETSSETTDTDGGGSDKLPKDVEVSAFDFSGLYERGAVVGWIPIPGAQGKGRRVSIKLHTVRERGPDGKMRMVNKLGIYDISNPGDDTTPPNIFGDRFDIKQGENPVTLTRDGHAYKLAIGEDGTIAFGSAEGGIKTSLGELTRKRAKQISEEGVVQRVGKRHYKLIGQAGSSGSWLYFPSDKEGKLIGAHPGRSPTLLAEVNKVGPDGWPETNTDSPSPLGFSGKNKEGKPLFWYAAWNEKHKYFEPKTCEKLKLDCDFPKEAPKTPPKPGTTPTTAPSTTTATTTTSATSEETEEETAREGATTRAPTGGSESLEACSFSVEQFNPGNRREFSSGGRTFRYWVAEGGSYFCFYGNALFQAQGGYLSSIEGAQGEGDLRVTIVGVKNPPSELDRVALESIVNGRFSITRHGRQEDYEVLSVTVYHLSKKALQAKRGVATTTQLPKVAWLVEERNATTPSQKSVLTVYTDDPVPGLNEASLELAMAMIQTSQDSSLFGGPENTDNRRKLMAFLKARIAADRGRMQDSRPNATIDLHLSDKNKNGGNVVVYTDRSATSYSQRWIVPATGTPYLEEPPAPTQK